MLPRTILTLQRMNQVNQQAQNQKAAAKESSQAKVFRP